MSELYVIITTCIDIESPILHAFCVATGPLPWRDSACLIRNDIFKNVNLTCWNAGEVSRQAVNVPARYSITACSINSQESFVIYHQILKKKGKKNFQLLISWPLVPYIDNIRVVSALTKLAFAIFYKNSRRNLSQVSNLSQIFYPILSLLLILPFPHHLFHIASAIREHSRRAVWSQ